MALNNGNGSIFVLRDTLSKYQPLSYFEYHMDSNKYVVTPTDIPNNYIHWLNIFNDVYGDFVDVLYPSNVKIEEDIIVLYRGFYQNENEWKEILWRHGDKHLFYYKILPLLKQEWTYPADLGEFEYLLQELD